MIWSGRVNAIVGLKAVVGLLIAAIGFWFFFGASGPSEQTLARSETFLWVGFSLVLMALAVRGIIVMTDKEAREQATRHFFKRAQRQAQGK